MKISKIIILSLFFFTSCGYNALNKLSDYNFGISKIELDGNRSINFILNESFERLTKKNSNREFDLRGNSSFSKFVISKDSSGNATSYKIEIIINLEIFENNKPLKEITFQKDTNFNNLNSQFELKQYENVLLEDLTRQLVMDINYYLSTL